MMRPAAEERQGTARYLQALAQHWPFIIGSVVLAIAAALVYLESVESRYEAHADILVSPVPSNDATFVGMPVLRDSGEGRGVLTAARLVKTPRVANAVRERLGLLVSRDDLLGAVDVEPQAQSNIVAVKAEASSADRAAAIANAFAAATIADRTRVFQQELRRVVDRLTDRLADLPATSREGGVLAERLGQLRGLIGSRDPTLQIASVAVPPAEESWPRPLLSLAVAGLVGLLLGVGVAIALELVNPLVLRDEDLLEQGFTLLARVPRTSTRDLRAHLAGKAIFPNRLRDAYRLVRVKLSAGRANGDGPRTILVTSASRGEGKTTAAVNLALVSAQAGARVVLVDADLRRASLGRMFGETASDNRMRDVLLKEASVEDSLIPARGYGNRLRLLTARPEDGDAIDVLQSHRIDDVVEELKSQAEVVIFDSPPVTEVADGLPLATAVDAVVIVVRFGRTRRDKLEDARLVLAQLGVARVGIVAVTRRRANARAETQRPLDRELREEPEAEMPVARTRSSSQRS